MIASDLVIVTIKRSLGIHTKNKISDCYDLCKVLDTVYNAFFVTGFRYKAHLANTVLTPSSHPPFQSVMHFKFVVSCSKHIGRIPSYSPPPPQSVMHFTFLVSGIQHIWRIAL